jgi:cellobiose phosphorylase
MKAYSTYSKQPITPKTPVSIFSPEERLGKILSDGRAPRQISFPSDENTIPKFDLRPYIDQGVWIISTIYTYLCYTDDYSILDENCSCFDLDTDGTIRKCVRQNTVLQHMLRIMEYLTSNIDTDKTGCLRVLYGDWNDALDGMGKTKDMGKAFGSGVSVMATLQLYQNLSEMTAILEYAGGYADTVSEYQTARENIAKGLLRFAVEAKGNGERHVIHGWGDQMGYKIGSNCDPDGQSRISLTANAFWAISGMLEKDNSIKADIIRDIKQLDSPYGLKTFSKPFPLSSYPFVGRIATITPGTYENSAAYVHAGIFGVMALFCAGESEMAWNTMIKSMVISHDNATMTTFVMPNSYCANEKHSIDGDSMGDWHTGSGTTLLKAIVRYGFGIVPALDGLIIRMAKHMPSQKAKICLSIKGCTVTLGYIDKGSKERKMYVNGREIKGVYDGLIDTSILIVHKDKLRGECIIEVVD